MSDLTKKALAEALKNRLSKTTLKNITIKDLTDDCGLNRQTFYYHFSDIYELMEWIFVDEANRILNLYSHTFLQILHLLVISFL